MLNLYGKQSVCSAFGNVPGTKEQRYSAGKPVRQQCFGPTDWGCGTAKSSMVSYNGHVQFWRGERQNLCDQPQLIMDAWPGVSARVCGFG